MEQKCIKAQDVLARIELKKMRFTIFILDCCRNIVSDKELKLFPNSPGTRGGSKTKSVGLRPMTPYGSLIAFACSPGMQAAEPPANWNETNGIYTKHLLEHIATPQTDVEMIFRRVNNGVRNYTEHWPRKWGPDYPQQIPYVNSCLRVEEAFLC